MRITQDFLNHLAPIERFFIQACITKLCLVTATDENDNILFKIVGF